MINAQKPDSALRVSLVCSTKCPIPSCGCMFVSFCGYCTNCLDACPPDKIFPVTVRITAPAASIEHVDIIELMHRPPVLHIFTKLNLTVRAADQSAQALCGLNKFSSRSAFLPWRLLILWLSPSHDCHTDEALRSAQGIVDEMWSAYFLCVCELIVWLSPSDECHTKKALRAVQGIVDKTWSACILSVSVYLLIYWLSDDQTGEALRTAVGRDQRYIIGSAGY